MFFFQRLRVTRASDPLAPLRSLEHAGIPFFGDMNPQRAKRSYDASRSRRLTKVFFWYSHSCEWLKPGIEEGGMLLQNRSIGEGWS